MSEAALLELLRDFARRTARERGVSDPRARQQLSIINATAKRVLIVQRQVRA